MGEASERLYIAKAAICPAGGATIRNASLSAVSLFFILQNVSDAAAVPPYVRKDTASFRKGLNAPCAGVAQTSVQQQRRP